MRIFRTVLFFVSIHEPWNSSSCLEQWKENSLLAVMMSNHHVDPREAVPDEVTHVYRLYSRRLLIDAVVAKDDDVVDNGHLRRVHGELICLHDEVLDCARDNSRTEMFSYLPCLFARCWDQRKRRVAVFGSHCCEQVRGEWKVVNSEDANLSAARKR